MTSEEPRSINTEEKPASLSPRPSFWRRRRIIILALLLLLPLGGLVYSWATFPSDKTPHGAYLRVVKAVNQGKPREFFAYTEQAAQHACYSIRDYRKKMLGIVSRSFPETEKAELVEQYQAYADAPDGSDVFALMVQENGWLNQLRKDLSGVKSVQIEGKRATVETIKGTRYAFRKRPGGIWGLTAFTPVLVEEAEKAARDLAQVEKAAADYMRVGAKSSASEKTE